MPDANLPPGDGLFALLKQLGQRLTAVENQQNWGVTDGNGVQRIKAGLQDDGTYGIWFFDLNGTAQVKQGDLGGGIYGQAVLNPAGVMQWIAGRSIQSVTGTLTYSSTSWGALTGGPSVTAPVGPSGEVDVALGSTITPGSYASGETAQLRVAVDGTGQTYPYLLVSVGASSTQSQTTYAEATISGLSPGVHTFTLQAWASTAGVAATYADTVLAVTPV